MIWGRVFLSADHTIPAARERMKNNLRINAGMAKRLATKKTVMQSEISRLGSYPIH